MVMINMDGIDLQDCTQQGRTQQGRSSPLYARVKDALERGNPWPEILRHFGMDQKQLSGKHCPCPGCGGKDRFRFDNKDNKGTFVCSQGNGEILAGSGWELIHHITGMDFQQALPVVADILRVEKAPVAAPYSMSNRISQNAVVAEPSPFVTSIDWRQMNDDTQKRYDFLRRVAQQSVRLDQLVGKDRNLALGYFRHRGIDFDRIGWPMIYFHPDLPDKQQHWRGPALIVWLTRPMDEPQAMQQGRVVGMQRLWLDPDLGKPGHQIVNKGKAPIETAKKSFAICDGAMISSRAKLYDHSPAGGIPAGGVPSMQIVGEGVETVLSWLMLAAQRRLYPDAVDACLSTSQLKTWRFPAQIQSHGENLHILEDNDEAGKLAVLKLRTVYSEATRYQSPVGNDFNDYLISLSQTRSVSCPAMS
ncbi:toprim domain-containing protein [Acidithiobacillus sp. MC6.1]|nr:toprim domain-containing protein [Acidithiobacillus sp. MC6.1]